MVNVRNINININNENFALALSIIMMVIFTYYYYAENLFGLVWSGVWFIVLTMDYYNCKNKKNN